MNVNLSSVSTSRAQHVSPESHAASNDAPDDASSRDAFVTTFLAGLSSWDTAGRGLAVLAGAATLEHFPPDARLVQQDTFGHEAWLIETGQVEVFRESEGAGQAKTLGILESGDVLGELALTAGRPRAASARALKAVTAWWIPRAAFEQALAAAPELKTLLNDKVYAQLARSFSRLQTQHGALQAAQANQHAFSFLFVAMMVLLSCYALVDQWVLDAYGFGPNSPVRFWYTRVMEVSSLGIFVTLARQTGMRLADMGVRWGGIGRAAAEGVLMTLPIMAVMYWLHVRGGAHTVTAASMIARLRWTNGTYLIVAPMQEWLARGMFQTSVERLLPWKRRGEAAVIVTSLVFAMFHLHINETLSQEAMLTSVFWGWMFLRHRNLAGVSLSHFLLGTWADLLG